MFKEIFLLLLLIYFSSVSAVQIKGENITAESIFLTNNLIVDENASFFGDNFSIFGNSSFHNNAIFWQDVQINGTLTGGSPIKVGHQGIQFVNGSDDIHYSIYHAVPENPIKNVSGDFNNSLIFQTDDISNPFQMEICFWDKKNQLMFFCINEGVEDRATTVRRSFQVVGNVSVKENDQNFTLCEGANYVDCSTDITGADLLVHDDIEAQSIYANENLTANESLIIGNEYIYINSTTKCELKEYTFVVDVHDGNEAEKLHIIKQNITILNCGNTSAWEEIIELDT